MLKTKLCLIAYVCYIHDHHELACNTNTLPDVFAWNPVGKWFITTKGLCRVWAKGWR